MSNTTSHIGLREQIAHAETYQQVEDLLKQGTNLQYASPRTRLSWKHTAQRRIKQLQQPVEKTVATSKEPVKKTKKVSKKK